jgi:signal transduction histidine kinase
VRSLTIKMVLAFLLTSVTGMALASLFIRASVARGFDDYVFDQMRDTLVADLGAYYEAQGSWEGIERRLRPQDSRRRSEPPPASKGAGGPPGRPLPFVLTDAGGIVIVSAERHQLGTRVAADDLARGTLVMVDGQRVGVLLTLERPQVRNPAEEGYLARTDTALIIAGAASVGIALILGVLLARLITRPVHELTAAASRIASGDLAQRVPVRSRDELGLLTVQFNKMSADLDRAIALRRQMTADIAHDLRTPLTVIAGYLEALRDRVLKPTPERFATLYAETQLLLRLVDDLHTLSLADAGELPLQRQPLAPRQLLARVADTYQHVAAGQGVQLVVEAADDLPVVSGDPELLARVLGNLMSNALRHTPSSGRVALQARVAPGGVHLTVSDTGAGIAPEHLPNIFERFYRADQARTAENGGSGLGLAIVRSLIEAHGGTVGVESTTGQGTTFTITLPRG